MPTTEPFSGAKLAALNRGRILTYRRDDIPSIPFPGLIDLPGGGREGEESPVQCALRELHEEFGLDLPPTRIVHASAWPHTHDSRLAAHFLALHLEDEDITAIRFGSEGSDPAMMPVAKFLAHPRAIPHLQQRLATCLTALDYRVF